MTTSKHFEVLPAIVPADRETEITIRPIHDPGLLQSGKTYEVAYFPCEEFSERSGWPGRNRPAVRMSGGALAVRQFFESEQEHVLLVEAVVEGRRERVGDFRVYSLHEDLFRRRPYKGDLHLHSNRSDGREAPEYVAGASRRIGLDFMALTDHGQYAPSLQARKVFENTHADLRIFPGEEVHPPDNPVHIVNFGGKFSVNELFADRDAYRAEVAEVQKKAGPMPPGVDPYQYASCLWVFDKVREAEGLGIFCHPYWFAWNAYTPSGALTSKLFEDQPFDAFEMIGGYPLAETDSNTLQVARYQQERAEGRKIPVVGSSDAHGCESGQQFGWFYTIVFSPSTEWRDLCASVKSLYSVAVEALPAERVRAYGPFRLVKYALFLLREVLPKHDELCHEEGRLMLAHVAGDAEAAPALARLTGRTRKLYDRLWGA